jgi:hypothetical protein
MVYDCCDEAYKECATAFIKQDCLQMLKAVEKNVDCCKILV